MDLLESVIHQPAREHQPLENPPTPKTIKHDFLQPDAIHPMEEGRKVRERRNEGRVTTKMSSLFKYIYHKMRGVNINGCDILRGIEEHPRIDVSTRATERQKHQDEIQK